MWYAKILMISSNESMFLIYWDANKKKWFNDICVKFYFKVKSQSNLDGY